MPLPSGFPTDPHAVLDPALRWRPDNDGDQPLPPLVAKLRVEVKAWRQARYAGASATTKALLTWWFETPHLINQAEFRYYFAQREAVETVVWLLDVKQVADKHDLMRFDSSGEVSANMFAETWRRFVVKMATGAGKTKVLGLVLAWSFFHKTYEADSPFSRNFLVVAPNIIVLDRLAKDFDGLRMFHTDPVLPDNGYADRNWREDFQLTVHKQDDVRVARKTGNIFLTNVHRVFVGNESVPTAEDDDTSDYFLGPRPTGATNDNRADLGAIVREIDELAVLNDEAHHIHDERLAWFTSIQDIHHRLVQKGTGLAFQVDVSATPKHNNGAVFVQTVADYPLVEAIFQNVVKHPVLPDDASRAKLKERPSVKFTERYADYLTLGVVEWRKTAGEHEKRGKKAVLFVMTDDTKNCDDVAAWMEGTFPDLKDAVLTIHTKNNGDVSEASSGKAKEELEELRKRANDIDAFDSPYKAIVSVLMLKEGWDVRNVTTIVGLRVYAAASKVLPEQTLGRGLRKMYPGGEPETLSVVGTSAFIEFVESIRAEGVTLDRQAMGEGSGPKPPLWIEVDRENPDKDIAALDIELPLLSPRMHREYGDLSMLDPATFGQSKLHYRTFGPNEAREIVFVDVSSDDVSHTTTLDPVEVTDWRNVVRFYAQTAMRDLRLVSGYDVLYSKAKVYVRDHLFGQVVDLEAPDTLRNLAGPAAAQAVVEGLKRAVNALTVKDTGTAAVDGWLRIGDTRPFAPKHQKSFVPQRSVFNRIIGDGGLELEFAAFLDSCPGVVAFAKNYLAVNFRLDYAKADGDLSTYTPDFLVRADDGKTYVIETKGREELDVPQKMARLRQWCEDANTAIGSARFAFVYVDQEGWEAYRPATFAELALGFREYQSG